MHILMIDTVKELTNSWGLQHELRNKERFHGTRHDITTRTSLKSATDFYRDRTDDHQPPVDLIIMD